MHYDNLYCSYFDIPCFFLLLLGGQESYFSGMANLCVIFTMGENEMVVALWHSLTKSELASVFNQHTKIKF